MWQCCRLSGRWGPSEGTRVESAKEKATAPSFPVHSCIVQVGTSGFLSVRGAEKDLREYYSSEDTKGTVVWKYSKKNPNRMQSPKCDRKKTESSGWRDNSMVTLLTIQIVRTRA